MNHIQCKSCDHTFSGSYCPNCGEKVLSDKDKSVKNWLGGVFADMSMIDGKFLLTLKELSFYPARYARNYADGIRVRYIKPLNLFLIANLIYFLFSSFNTFKTSLEVQMEGLPYSPWAKSVVEKKMENEGLKLEEYALVYEQKTNEISKLMLIVLAPCLGLLLFLLFGRQPMMLSEGFNLALQFWSFFILFFMFFLPFISKLIRYFGGTHLYRGETVTSVMILAVSAIYLWFMLKPWQANPWLYVGKVILLIASFLPSGHYLQSDFVCAYLVVGISILLVLRYKQIRF